jgi:hypothetical protein
VPIRLPGSPTLPTPGLPGAGPPSLPSPPTPSAPSTPSTPLPATDPRRDMMKELVATQLVTAGKVDDAIAAIVTKSDEVARARGDKKADRSDTKPAKSDDRFPDLKPTAPKSPPSVGERPVNSAPQAPPTSESVQRALQLLQREAGLPITGRFDDATLQLLKNLGIGQPKPEAKPAEPPKPEAPRKPIDATTKADARARAGGGADAALLRAKLLEQTKPTQGQQAESTAVDRAFDPARLIASLFAAGFSGSADKALAAFQGATGLPVSGQLDKATVDALVKAGHMSEQEAAHTTSTSTAAGGAGSTSASDKSADKAKESKDTRAQAQTTAPKSAGETATRAPASTAAEARERARLESLLAQAAATERGVQEGTGDPHATEGHGTPSQTAGSGVSGAGGQGGGAVTVDGHEAAAIVDDGAAGDEDSVGNAKAGDDDHDDDRRGNASDVVAEFVDDGTTPEGHYRVAKLSEQVQAALETIARLDDGTVPVHYTWDVTLHRPGVYAEGQPAEALWHLVVERAHAFDPVWARAAQAIAARLLYVEPDAEPLTHDELMGALRRARVR